MQDSKKSEAQKVSSGNTSVKDEGKKSLSSAVSNKKIRSLAEEYMKSKGKTLTHPKKTYDVSPERGAKIAKAYEKMKHEPENPKVKKAYDALIKETADQFNFIKNKTGLQVSKLKPDMENPYPNGSKDLIKDLAENNHMWYYPTEQGYGSTEVNDHPLLKKTDVKTDEDENVPANDLFRIVHDYFGHGKEGFGFGPQGEDNAWLTHKQMYSPDAQKALTSETRGQNSWVNYGPKGEENRVNPANTTYAEQKAGLLPDWVMQDVSDTGRDKLSKGGKVHRGPTQKLKHIPTHKLKQLAKDNHVNPDTGFEIDPEQTHLELASRADRQGERDLAKYKREQAQGQPAPSTDNPEDWFAEGGSVQHYADGTPDDGVSLPHFDEPQGVNRSPALADVLLPQEEPSQEIQNIGPEITKQYVPVWDVSGAQPVKTQISHDSVDSAIQSGKYAFDSKTSVPMFNPQGELMEVEAPDAEKAMQGGWRYAPPHQIAQHKYGTLKQQAITGLEGVAQGLLGPAAAPLEVGLGLANKEEILGRREVNPATHGLAEAAGFLLPAAATLGESALARVGMQGIATAAEHTVPGLVGQLAEKIIPQGGKWYARVSSGAARGAFEGALLEGGDQVTRAYLDDPSQSAENAISAIGLGGVLGSLIGGVTHGGIEAFKGAKNLYAKHVNMEGLEQEIAAGKKFGYMEPETVGAHIPEVNPQGEVIHETLAPKENAPEVGPKGELIAKEGENGEHVGTNPTEFPKDHPEAPVFVSEVDRPKFESGDFKTAVDYDPSLSETAKKDLIDELASPKKNAAKIDADIKEVVGDPTFNTPVSYLTESPFLHLTEDSMIKSNSVPGIMMQKNHSRVWNSISTHLDNILGNTKKLSKAQLGEEVAAGLSHELSAEGDPVSEIYNIVRPKQKTMFLDEGDLKQAQSEILKIANEEMLPGESHVKMAERYANDFLPLRKTVDDIQNLNTQLHNSIPKVGANQNELSMVNRISDVLKKLEDDAIISHAKKATNVSPQERQQLNNLLGMRKEADLRYSKFIGKVKKLAEYLGAKNKVKGQQSAINFLKNDISPDLLIQKLSSKKDVKFLKFFEENFKNEADLLKQYRKAQLLENPTTGDPYEPATVLRNIFGKKMEPEEYKFLFKENEREFLEKMNNIVRNTSKYRNWSNTQGAADISEMFKNGITGAAVSNLANLKKSMLLQTAKRRIIPKKYAEGGIVDDSHPLDYTRNERPPAQLGEIANPTSFVTAINQPPSIKQAQKLGQDVVKGHNMLENSVKNLFNVHSTHRVAAPSDKQMSQLKQYIDKAKVDPSFLLNMAESPMTRAAPELAKTFAETAAKAANYLQTLEPPKPKSYGFDSNMPAPPTVHTDKYKHVLRVAEQPLFILNKVRDGTVIPEEVGAVKTIYPKLYQNLSNQITQHMIDAKHKNVTVPYRTKLGLSLFLGEPLDSTMQPLAIQAAQPKPQGQPQQGAQQGQVKHSTNSLNKLSNMAKTPSQNRDEARSTKQ